jgi:hypothetical protein
MTGVGWYKLYQGMKPHLEALTRDSLRFEEYKRDEDEFIRHELDSVDSEFHAADSIGPTKEGFKAIAAVNAKYEMIGHLQHWLEREREKQRQ